MGKSTGPLSVEHFTGKIIKATATGRRSYQLEMQNSEGTKVFNFLSCSDFYAKVITGKNATVSVKPGTDKVMGLKVEI